MPPRRDGAGVSAALVLAGLLVVAGCVAVVVGVVEGLLDRIRVLESLAHPPANRAHACPKCARQPADATTTTRKGTP